MYKISLLLVSLAFGFYLKGQSTQSLVPSVPTSPQAEAIKTHGDINVNPSTGTPDISIPLYEINHYGYKLPLSLRYVAQPIKPGYNFDVFGLGWSLSLSSCISRSIEYVPDEWKNFKLEVPGGTPGLEYFNLCGTSCLTNYNYAHDKFNVVLPNGSSFNFIIDNQNENISIKVSDGRNVKIAYSIYNTAIQWFTVIDESGVKYTFDTPEYPRSGGYMPYENNYVSWLLTRIDLPHSTEPILFEYGTTLNPFATSCGEPSLQFKHYRKKYWDAGVYHYYDDLQVNRTTAYTPSAYSMRLLSSINFGKGGNSQVRLFYEEGSESVQTIQAKKIELREAGSLIREFGLETLIRDGNTPCFTYPVATLKNVTIKGNLLADIPQKYECTNNSIASFSGVDHWGNLNTYGSDLPYFNIYFGKALTDAQIPMGTINAGLVNPPNLNVISPVVKEPNDPSPFFKYKISQPGYALHDCKKANEPTSHGVLSRLTYPTGGFTDFEYENHQFLTSTDGSGNYLFPESGYVRLSINASAFRIKTITNYQQEGLIASKKNYRYGKILGEPNNQFGHQGYGLSVVDPNILTYLDHNKYSEQNYPEQVFNFSVKNIILGLNYNGIRQPFTNPFYLPERNYSLWSLNGTISSANFRKILNGRQPVVYSEVSVYDGEINENNNIFPKGKTVYKYDLEVLLSDKWTD